MGAELYNTVVAAADLAQYDEKAKHLLAQKSILSYILAKTVDEFKGMKPKDIEKYIVRNAVISGIDRE